MMSRWCCARMGRQDRVGTVDLDLGVSGEDDCTTRGVSWSRGPGCW